ncbi:MAG: hypothetical protein KAI83_04065 [Thiomargarita sp.]|nr:hypothetical protein [Thiomargarita sp.]
MSTLTIELPEILFQQIQTYKISLPGLEKMFVRLVQEYINEYQKTVINHKESPAPTTSIALDGETFARQVIANNRLLFEELARL